MADRSEEEVRPLRTALSLVLTHVHENEAYETPTNDGGENKHDQARNRRRVDLSVVTAIRP